MDRLDKLEWRLDLAIKIGTPVAIVVLVLCFDASYQIRRVTPDRIVVEVAKKLATHLDSTRTYDRRYLDSTLNYYLAPTDSLEGP